MGAFGRPGRAGDRKGLQLNAIPLTDAASVWLDRKGGRLLKRMRHRAHQPIERPPPAGQAKARVRIPRGVI